MIQLTLWRKGDKEPEYREFNTFREAKQAAFGFKKILLRCDSCEAAVINGHFCHEQGCPEAWRDQPGECRECGCDFQRRSRHDSTCDECLRGMSEAYLEDVAKQEYGGACCDT